MFSHLILVEQVEVRESPLNRVETLHNFHLYDTDYDECTFENGGCADICVNTPGSYHCECGPTKALVLNSTTECEGTVCNCW